MLTGQDHSSRRHRRQGAGVLIIASDTGRFLLARRSEEVTDPGTWTIPGGGVEPWETPSEAAAREAREEVGCPVSLDLVPSIITQRANFTFHNFMCLVGWEFRPRINWESSDADWFSLDELPEPLHPGVSALLATVRQEIERVQLLGELDRG